MSATRILGQPVSLETSKTKEPEQGLLDVVCGFDVVQTILERLIHGFRDFSGTTAARKADRCREIAATWWPAKNCQSDVSINRHRVLYLVQIGIVSPRKVACLAVGLVCLISCLAGLVMVSPVVRLSSCPIRRYGTSTRQTS